MNNSHARCPEEGVRCTGVLSEKEIAERTGVPSLERLRAGPIAVIECQEQIPCNPCEAVCSNGAIQIGEPIVNIPSLDPSKCTGCGLCLSCCPGLAIFLLDTTPSDGELISFPYEFLPLPRIGDIVSGLDRYGEPICKGEAMKVETPSKNDHTSIVTLLVPKGYGMRVRSMSMER